ncbi:PAP2 superfamily protein [Thozetella sp. PMI_491]|nr:PAP2 superfamily protein [Thozetella sp. PMI_491]
MADDAAPLASLSLTHVYYDPDDHVSFLCAWLALVPQALCIVYVTLIWSTREAEVALMFAGQLACEAANFVLKRIIKEERPRRIHLTGKGYGMPSSHAQFAAFWAVALTLFLVVRHRPGTSKKKAVAGAAKRSGAIDFAAVERYAHQPWSMAERVLASLGAMALAGGVAWSRIYLGYHTEKQVMVGCLAGTVCAVAWFVATSIVRQIGLLAWALEIPVARWFRLRDLLVEEDMCQAGWEKWEAKNTAAAGKKAS